MSDEKKARSLDAHSADDAGNGDDDALAELTESMAEPATLLTRVVALFPLMICFMGTGRNSWALALMALTVGGLVLLNPPRSKLPFALVVVMGSIALLTLLPLVPIQVPFPSAWKVRLVEDIGIHLAPTWSVQPWVTLENWLSMMVIMVWFAWLVTQHGVTEHRALILRMLASGIAWLAVVALVFYYVGWRPASWSSGSSRDIGPFANRNHFSSLMAMNAILCLACAYDLLRRKKRQWVLYALGLVPCFAVILVNTSRAGLVLFFTGVILWFFVAALRKRSLKRLAVGGSLLLACTAGTVLFAQQLLTRFSNSQEGVIEHLTSDSRFALYQDTLDMILQHPVLGVGLGNFGAVFGLTNHMKEAFVRFRHPESDLLWFVAEAGWPAAVAGLVGVLFFLRWMGPWRVGSQGARRRERRLRLAAGLAVLLVLAHGLVDTPGHGMPMALLLALLAALALHGSKLSQSRGILMTWGLRLGGILSIIAGVAWMLTWAGFHTFMGESVWARDLQKARRSSDAEVVATGWSEVQSAIKAAPINWEAYFYRASIGLRMGRPTSEAMTDFGRARYLEPNVAQICMAEANVWLRHQPTAAVPAWREALQRDRSEGGNRYRVMLGAAQEFPELRASVRALASDAKLMLLFLISCNSETEFKEVLAEMLSRYPALDGLSHYERGQFLQLWRNRGDRKALAAALETHQGWLDDGWTSLAAEYADAGKPQKAYELAMEHLTPPVTMTLDPSYNLEALQREFLFNPSDARRGFNLAIVQREQRHYADSLATLDKVALQPNAPKQVYFEMAKVHARTANFVKAWECLAKYLQL